MIEQNLERIATALEKIAVALKPNEEVIFVKQETDRSVKEALVSPKPEDPPEREAIKAKLVELGVKFGAKTSTENLKALLAKSLGEGAKPLPAFEEPKKEMTDGEKVGAIEGMVSQALEIAKSLAPKEGVKAAPSVTKEQAFEALKLFATKYGADKAKDVLSRVSASKFSEVKPEDYEAFMKFMDDKETQTDMFK